MKGKISYLPWTPEVGIVRMLASDVAASQISLRDYFGDSRISLEDTDLATLYGLSGVELRKKCKALLRQLISHISTLTIRSEERIRDDVSMYFAEKCLSGSEAQVLTELLLPKIKA